MFIWTKSRKQKLYFSLILGITLSCLIVWLKDDIATSSLKRGDFPAFYAAAEIIYSGRAADLYRPEVQREVENVHWASLNGTYYAFAYPPYVALLLSPLALLSALQAKVLFTILLVLSLAGAAVVLRRLRPEATTFELFIAMLCFAPIFSAVPAGQNTSLGILLYALSIYFASKRTHWGEVLAGVALGLWLFKPNFALIALGFVFLGGRYRMLLGAMLPAFVYYVAGVLVLGFDWPKEWVEAIANFAKLDLIFNRHQMVSLSGVADAIVHSLELGPRASVVVYSSLFLLGLVVFATTAFQFMLFVTKKRSGAHLEHALYLLAPAVILLSPHTLYYDLGFLAVPFARYQKVTTDRDFHWLFILFFIVFVLTFLKQIFPIQPLAALAVGGYFWTLSAVRAHLESTSHEAG